MSDQLVDKTDMGTVTVLLRRASRRRIPRLKRIKKAVDKGARLTNFQINFLAKVFEDSRRAAGYIDHHQELHKMYTKIVALYHDITEQALKNEEAILQKKAPPIDFPPGGSDSGS